MIVTVKYFALLREAVGCAEEEINVPSGIKTVGELRIWVADLDEHHKKAFAAVSRIRAAVDGTMSGDDAEIEGAKEIAFFPPVTGG